MSRAKGYMDWRPQPHVMEVVEQAQAVLAEYSSYGPMTVRQIFYRLVGQYGYPKDEKAYKRLAEYLVKARRAGMIGFGQIRDDGTIAHHGRGETTRADVWEYLRDLISRPQDYLHLDRRTGQPHYIELWCEAGGMAPMLAQMVSGHDVSVYSTGGFSSVTVTFDIAQRVITRDKPTYFLHVGDYDPSGESIFTSMSQDVGSFVSGRWGSSWQPDTGRARNDDGVEWFIPQRVALTADQIEEFDLPTAPPKLSDSRSANWYGETTQAEAMPPDLLERVVTEAIDELTDEDALAGLKDREREDKRRLRSAVEDLSVVEVIDDRGLGDPSLLELVQAIADHDLED